MKRITALLLIFLLAMSLLPGASLAEKEISQPNEAEIAQGLLNALSVDTSVIKGTDDSYITRGSFMVVLADIFKIPGYNNDVPFNDVSSPELKAAVRWGLDEELLSEGESFYPDREITYNEAYKICVAAVGRKIEAERRGGYPTGYTVVAGNIGLTDDIVSAGEKLSAGNFYILMFNLLRTGVMTLSGVKGDYVEYTDSNTTLLEEFYNLTEIEGIVTATEKTSLYDPSYTAEEGRVEIDSVSYTYSGDAEIGKKVTAYIDREDKIMYLHADGNKEIRIEAKDLTKISKNEIREKIEKNSFRYRLESKAAIIYNGKTNNKISLDSFSLEEGYIVLTDNDRNGVYDVVNIMKPTTVVVGTALAIDKKITDKNGNILLDLSSDDMHYSIRKNGNEATLLDIKTNSLLMCYISSDSLCTEIHICDNRINGEAEAFGSDREIYIGEVMYKYSSYFEKYYMPRLKLGDSAAFMLSDDGVIQALLTDIESEMQFGYLIDIAPTGRRSTVVQVKYLDSSGEIVVSDMAKKFILNGEKDTAENCYKEITKNGVIPQIIRYRKNGEELKAIDTLEASGILSGTEDRDNNLTKFVFPSASMYSTIHYIYSTGIIHPYVYVPEDIAVFVINQNERLTEEQRYRRYGKSYILSNPHITTSELSIYNVSAEGSAGAIILTKNSGAADDTQAGGDAVGGVVVSLRYGIDTDGNSGRKLTLYDVSNSVYRSYYITDDLLLQRFDNGLTLNKGDYIRYVKTEDGYITGITKDFDYESKTVLTSFGNHLDTPSYYFGKVYSKEGNLISLHPENIPGIIPDKNDSSTRYSFVIPESVKIYAPESAEEIYQASSSEIIAMLQSESSADYVLIRTNEGNIQQVIVYREGVSE